MRACILCPSRGRGASVSGGINCSSNGQDDCELHGIMRRVSPILLGPMRPRTFASAARQGTLISCVCSARKVTGSHPHTTYQQCTIQIPTGYMDTRAHILASTPRSRTTPYSHLLCAGQSVAVMLSNHARWHSGSVSGTMSGSEDGNSLSLHAAFTFAFGILLAFRIRAKRAHRLAIPGADAFQARGHSNCWQARSQRRAEAARTPSAPNRRRVSCQAGKSRSCSVPRCRTSTHLISHSAFSHSLIFPFGILTFSHFPIRHSRILSFHIVCYSWLCASGTPQAATGGGRLAAAATRRRAVGTAPTTALGCWSATATTIVKAKDHLQRRSLRTTGAP